MAKDRRALLLIGAFATVYVVWGSTYLTIRWAVDTIPPLLMAGSRQLAAGLILYAWARRRNPAPTPRQWKSAGIIGVLLLLGGNGGVSWVATREASGLMALIVATVPLWMVALHAMRDRASLTLRVGLGVLVGLAGIAILVGDRDAGGIAPLSAAVLVLASLSWAAGSLYARRAELPKSPAVGTGAELLLGGLALLAAGLLLGEAPRVDFAAVSLRSALSWVYLVFFGSVLAFTAYIYMLNHSSPAAASSYAYVNPVVAVLLGWAFAGEPVTARTLLAGAVILGGVVLLTLKPAPKAPPAAPAVAAGTDPS